MAPSVDEYIERVILQGDQGSNLLRTRCAPTLRNSDHVEVIESPTQQLAVLNIPHGYDVVVHSAAGDPEKEDVCEHARSMVIRLANQARELGITPVGFANVIDSRTGDLEMLERVVTGLVGEANAKGLAILNGENAILGGRVAGEANVCGTMISTVPNGDSRFHRDRTVLRSDISLARFDPTDMPVFVNADGVGTKTEFYERTNNPEGALGDFLAMNLDDASKLAAIARVVGGVLEVNGTMSTAGMMACAREFSETLRISIALQIEDAPGRINGCNADFSYNLGGAVVSTIDRERLQHPLVPSVGEYLVAITGTPNPRSNGITDKRRAMIALFGDDYHNTELGKTFLEYLAEPSTVLYGIFNRLTSAGLATSVYHMSGGAFNGKLARPLAQHGLFVTLEDLFPPDWRELTLAGVGLTSAEEAYAKWPMGNDGFVTTTNPEETIRVIESTGLRARRVGQLEEASNRTGVELETIAGKTVHYSGKD